MSKLAAHTEIFNIKFLIPVCLGFFSSPFPFYPVLMAWQQYLSGARGGLGMYNHPPSLLKELLQCNLMFRTLLMALVLVQVLNVSQWHHEAIFSTAGLSLLLEFGCLEALNSTQINSGFYAAELTYSSLVCF